MTNCIYCGEPVSADREKRARDVMPIAQRKTAIIDTCSQKCRTAWSQREKRKNEKVTR